jgi:putative oxidoreductase
LTKDVALLVLRLSGFVLAFAHGWRKIALLASGNFDGFISGVGALGFPMPGAFSWAAGLAEFAGGLAIALGIATRVAAGFAAFTMFVAAFLRHKVILQILIWLGGASYAEDVVESWGNPERAALFLLIFIALVLLGGGRFSLDRLVRSRKRA